MAGGPWRAGQLPEPGWPRLAQGFFPSLFDRLRLIWVLQFRRFFPAALFPFHLCQLPHNLPLIRGDPLLDGAYIFKVCSSVNK